MSETKSQKKKRTALEFQERGKAKKENSIRTAKSQQKTAESGSREWQRGAEGSRE